MQLPGLEALFHEQCFILATEGKLFSSALLLPRSVPGSCIIPPHIRFVERCIGRYVEIPILFDERDGNNEFIENILRKVKFCLLSTNRKYIKTFVVRSLIK